jgi:serralysin
VGQVSVFDPLLYVLEDSGRSARWNFPLAVNTPLPEFAGIGTAVSVTYSFMAGVPAGYESPGDHPGFAVFDAGMQAGARRALADWAAVANLTFTEVSDAGDGGQIRFGRETMTGIGGYAYPPNFAYGFNPLTSIVTDYNPVPWMGDVYISNDSDNDAVAEGAYGYHVLLHELGHTIGLQHSFEGADPLAAAQDNLRYTIMAYHIPADLGIVTVTGDASSYAWSISDLYPSTPMLYDIAAAQYLYGANTATNAGDTRYAWAPNARLLETIWDGGGSDTVDTSNQTLPSIIDLNDGHFSSIAMRLTDADRRLEIPAFATAVPAPSYAGVDNLAIAFGAVIENARGGAGHDRLIGNTAANRLEGGAGNDTLEGGAGADTLSGGTGDDSYAVDSQADVTFENAGEGSDTVSSTAGCSLYADIETLVLSDGAGDIFGAGNEQANTITGNEGANLIIGLGGGDSVLGNAGNDILHGGDGDDSMEGGAGLDSLIGGAGRDTLAGGEDADVLYGEAGDDHLAGGADDVFDQLVGGEGSDTLDGASGLGEYDYLYGGTGDDVFHVDTPADLVFEFAGEGNDSVFADIAGGGYCLYQEIENLTLLGATPFGVGNALDNRVTGSATANWLFGGAGADTLNGMAGNDVLYGEAGADSFVFERGTGGDAIGDFTSGLDHILLVGLGFTSFGQVQAAFSVVGGSSAINLGQGDLIVLPGVTSLAEMDVHFA